MHVDPLSFAAFPVFVLSLVVQECARGIAASWAGDPTARASGRLTLDPRPHVSPVGTLVVPVAMLLWGTPYVLGWARRMPVEHGRLRDPRNGPVWVALAGPATHVLLAVAFAGLVRIAPREGFAAPLGAMCLSGVSWNCALAVFNMVPLPPLDGAWVLMRFLRLRHIIALHQARLPAFAVLAALLLYPPTAAWLAIPLRAMVRACLALYGGSPPGATP